MQSIKDFLVDHALSTQLLLYATIIVSLWLAECLFFAESSGKKWKHSKTNGFVMLSALPVQLCTGVLLVTVASFSKTYHWGLVYMTHHFSSPWIKYGLMILALDFLDYAYHRVMHSVNVFWRFHLVHHTDSKVDVSTTIREHPVETALRNSFMATCVLICGASPQVLILRQTAQSFINLFSHTSFYLPPTAARILGFIFMTPNLHHVHHHFKLPYTNRNYGDILSVWDRLFGTYIELDPAQIVYGLDLQMDENINGNCLRIITMPFRRQGSIAHKAKLSS